MTDQYGAAAVARFYREIETNRHKDAGLGMPELERMGLLDADRTSVKDHFRRNVNHFLNRIMVLPVDKQNAIFELFYERYLQAVEGAKRAGAFDFGVEQIRASHLKHASPPQTLYTDPATAARTVLYELEGEVDVTRNDFDRALRNAREGFYQNSRSGHIYAVENHQGDTRNDVLLLGVKGSNRRLMERRELDRKYEKVSPEVARKWWDTAHANTPATATRKFHILTGAIVPIYDKIMGGEGIDSTRVARASLESGEALVGFHLSTSDVPKVKQRLGIGNSLAEASASEILELLRSGSLVELDNGWRLTLSRVAGDDVVELVLSGVIANKDELRGYGFFDETIYYKRRWFTHVEDAPVTLERLLSRRRPVRDMTAETEAA